MYEKYTFIEHIIIWVYRIRYIIRKLGFVNGPQSLTNTEKTDIINYLS